MDTKELNSNLLFLLAAAPIGLGCIIVDDGDDDTTGADTNNPTTGATSSNDTGSATDNVDTGVATEGATGGTGNDETAGPADTGTTAGEDDTGSATTTGGAGDACGEYGALITYCYDEKSGSAAETYCAESLAYYTRYGADCGAAFEDYMACLSGLTCKELGAGATGCDAALEAFLGACPTAE